MKTLHTIYTNFAKRLALVLTLLLTLGVTTAWAANYSLTPNKASTGLSNTQYITTLTEFTYNGITWKMNQWNPSTLQIKTNQGTNTNEFHFYNTTAFPGKITKVVITFKALTVSNENGFMFIGGTSVQTGTSNGTSGKWDANNKTITWTPAASDNFTFFAFYQNGKVASGTNYLAESDAIVVTYESGYAVTYNNGGRGTAPSNTTASSVKLSAITATGYTNTGWKADVAVKNGSNTISAGTLINNGTTVTLTQATTFTAQWQANKYTITLDNQSATSTGTTSVIATYDSNSNLTSAINIPSKTHHNFGGYYTQTNGNGTQLIDSEGKFKAGVSGYTDADKIWKYANNITLYAKWTEKDLVRYRTSCECIPPTVTIKPITEFGWRYSIGETIGLNAIIEGASGDCTYQWQKYVGDQWLNIEGATNETFTKENCTTNDGGSYRCVVNAGNDCIAESEPYYVRVFTLNGYYYNEEIAANKIEWTGENTGVATIHLGQSRTYLFKVTDNEGKWFGYGDYAHFNYIVQPWQADCGIETGNGTNTDIRLFTGPEGDYTFTINIEHALDNEPYVNIAVAYPEVEHPVAGYGYVTKWWDHCYIHWWDNNDQALTEWGSDAQITTYTEICETEYYFFPIIDNYINLIIKDAEGDPSNTTGDQTQTGHSGWYITHDGNSWGWHEFATYTITFVANGGNGTMDALSGICPTTDKTLTPNAFTRSGYTFAGWKANKNVTINGVSVAAGTLITDCATIQNIVSNITLTAQWTPKNITITWDANGGSVTPTSSTYTYNGATITPPTPTRANYIFNGWFTATTGGTKITEVGTNNKPTEDVTYYAQWTAKATPTFAWSADACTVTIASESNVFPTLTTNPADLVGVKYESSKPDVATIDADGNIVLKSAGTTIIRAYYEEDATYAAAEDTYTLTVKESTNCWWEEVTIDDIEYGDEVVIAMQTEAGIYAMSINDDNTATPDATLITVSNLAADNGIGIDLTWYIEKDANGKLIIRPKKDITKNVYCNPSTDNNRVRVGNNHGNHETYKTFEIEGNYLKNSGVYYIGVNFSKNQWWGYVKNSNLPNQTLKFYKRICLPEGQYRVTWMVAGQEYTAGNPTTLVTNGKISAIPTAPADLTLEDCGATKFMGWSTQSSGSVPQNAAYYSDLFTTLAEAQQITINENKTFYAVFATKGSGGIAQGTVLWAENFEHFGTKTPSEAGTGTGTTIYGDASITYSQSSNNTKGYAEEYAGGTKPELLLAKSNTTWTIAGVPTGGATKMTLSFLSNRTEFNVTSSTTGITVSGSEKTWTITADENVATYTLTIKNTSDKNARLDNVSVIVAEGGVSYSNYVTNCCNTPAPTNGAYTSVSDTEIKLTWDDAANTNHYHITGGNLSAEGVYSTNKYCNITRLTECNEYTFYVSAYPEGGCESAAIAIIAQPYSGAKTVTFNPNGGAVSPTSFTTSCDKKSTTLPTPTYSGYRFMGWFTAESGGTEIDDNPYTPTEDITLFAHWEKEYTVTYDLQGGTASPVCSGDKYIAGEIVTICTSTPIKSGYKFTGWTYSPVVTITNGQFTMPASNVTITAEFVARAVTNIEVATNTHRVLMQGSAFIGEQIRVTYDNGETELLEWSNSKLTFTGHNTNELGVQTVTVTYTGEGTAHTQYNIEVIDGLGITFWDDDYTETIKYEPGDLVDVDNRIGQNICSGWEFVGWSETKVANKSNGFTPVRNFNATDAKVLYAVYVETSTDWISAYNIDELHSGAKYVIVAHYSDSKEYALTNTNNTNSSYLDGANLTTDCEQVREGDAYPYKDRYKLKVTPQPSWKWQLVNTGSGWTMRNISANKYLKINTDKSISLTTTPDDKFTLSNGSNDSEITAQSSSNNYLSWYNSSKYWNGHTSGKQYYLTNETNFTSTPPCSRLSATFHGNGGIVTDGESSLEDLPITEPTRDAGITTPTASFADCNGKSWTFVGWSREEIDVTRVPVLTTDLLHDGGGNKHYYIQEDGEEFWAVYTNTGDPETKYGTITFTDADVTRQYENAKTITKSVTAMGDYDFELYHVSNASSKGIQFDHDNATRGYIKNITSLGKINSISFNDFQVGDIDYVKVYVGNTPNAINTLLTEADLQQTGNTYTYYPQKNYAYVKIEATDYCGITSISIDFGKGTQIWATTPDCSTITLSGDEIYVTATNGRAVMAPTTLTVKANQLEANADVILTSNSKDVYFSLDRSFNFAAGQAANQKPKTSLTLPTDSEGNLATTDVYIHYMPSSEGDGVPANVIISANLETPNPSITDDHTIHVRNLPAKFVIATKVGATWYALPANMTGDTNPLAEVIEVDETMMTATAPNTSTYTLWPVKTTNGTGDRYVNYGDRVRFAAVNYEQRGLWANNNNNGSTIRNYAVIDALGADALAAYEWKVTTTVVDGHWQYTLQTDQDKNQNFLRYWTSAEGTPVGPKWGTYNAGENKLYFLPVIETQPFEYAVVEWYPTKVLIQTDAAITSPTVKVDGEAVASPILTNKGGKLYEISNLPLETNPNKLLQISFTDNAINYTNTKVVPIILSRGAKTITGEPFATLTQKVYQYADVVVRDGATLSIDATTNVANTLLGVTIYPTAKVSVEEGKKLSVHSLTFFGGIDEIYNGSSYEINKYGVPQLSLKGSLNKTVTNMDYIMRVDLKQMYQVGVPYDVNLNDITYWDGTAMTLGDNLYVSAYDGQKRANLEPTGSWVWEVNFAEKVLKAGIGYTISADKQDANHEYSIIRMPMKSNITSGSTETAKTVQVYAYANTNGVEITDNNKGWNYLSNPYMAAISGAEADKKLVVGYLDRDDVAEPWKWVEDDYRYVTIPSDDGTYHYQQKFSTATLYPFKSFFLQIATDGELSFDLASRQSAPARYLQSNNEQREVEFEVLLANDTRSDNLGLLISEAYTPAYEINADLEKMIGSMSVYTIYNGYNLAYNALSPANAEEQIPIGYVVPTVGEYTWALDESSNIEDVEHIYLIDYETSAITDLVTDVYTFTASEQKSDTRFAINVTLKSKESTVTGLVNINKDSEQSLKFIHNDKIYILHNGVIYDATGKFVETINK